MAQTTPVRTVSLLDNADNSIIDDIWAWRADHGNAVGWTDEQGDTGLDGYRQQRHRLRPGRRALPEERGDLGGQGGTDVFFQNELPYDPPNQSDWMVGPTQDGYPAFLVTPNVRTFHGYGMGSYVVFIDTTATMFDRGLRGPRHARCPVPGHLRPQFAGSGGDNSVINGVADPVTSDQ